MDHQRFFSRLNQWIRANALAWPELLAKTDWLRSARLARGLQGQAMARRLGVSPARVSVMERDEARGAVTLKMMQKAAQALDCEFVYLLVPKQSLSGPSSHKPKIRVRPAGGED